MCNKGGGEPPKKNIPAGSFSDICLRIYYGMGDWFPHNFPPGCIAPERLGGDQPFVPNEDFDCFACVLRVFHSVVAGIGTKIADVSDAE